MTELAWHHSRARSRISATPFAAMTLVPSAILWPKSMNASGKMSDERQYAPATLRDRDFEATLGLIKGAAAMLPPASPLYL